MQLLVLHCTTACISLSLRVLHKLLLLGFLFKLFHFFSLLHIAVQTSSYSLAHRPMESFHFSREIIVGEEKGEEPTFGQQESVGADLELPTCLLACYCLPLWSAQHQVTVPQPPL